jgi:pilus assembly protein Flp/PilA
MKSIREMFGDTKGATAIEYGLLAALIAVAAITAMNALGGHVNNVAVPAATEVPAGD